MCSNKEQLLINKLSDFLQGDEIGIGDRLPSERNLADRFNTSRNTLRNAIKMLQANGIIKVKPGSGYYLLSKSNLDVILEAELKMVDKNRIKQNLEAFYLFEPTAVSLATLRISQSLLKELEKCIFQLSQAVLENNAEKFTNNHHNFHQIIRSATENSSIGQMLQKLELTYSIVSDMFTKCTPDDRNQIFAAHINLFNAVKSKDPKLSRRRSQEMIVTISNLMEQYEEIELPNVIKYREKKSLK